MTFGFEAAGHRYVCPTTGRIYPHITGMLKAAGIVDERWFTEAGRVRGTAVHRLVTEYDLGVIEHPEAAVSTYKGYLLGYVAAMRVIPHAWTHIEEAMVHPRHLFAGRPDRLGTVYNFKAVVEVKTCAYVAAHGIQTALQAILAEDVLELQPERVERFVLSLWPTGRWTLHQCADRQDFITAREVIRCHATA